MKKKQAQIHIVCFGTELLDGSVLDTNSRRIAESLHREGFDLHSIRKVADSETKMLQVLEEVFQKGNLVITTGGLGPTFDDMTIPVLAKFFGRKLSFNRYAYESIAAFFKMKKRTLKERHRLQAFLPEGCQIVQNSVGVCPALFLEDDQKAVLAMPGVPREMEGMLESSVLPFLKKRYRADVVWQCVIRTAGVAEVALERRILPLVKKHAKEGCSFGVYPGLFEVRFKITVRKSSKREAAVVGNKLKALFIEKLGKAVYSERDEELVETVSRFLIRSRKRVSVAESCTGGWLAKQLTDVSGSSRYFSGGILAYENRIKSDFLDVPRDVLQEFGAVSKQTASHMAVAVRRRFKTSLGLSLTGIAGPSGGSQQKPVGLVFIGLADETRVRTYGYQFRGDRESVRLKAVKAALLRLVTYLK